MARRVRPTACGGDEWLVGSGQRLAEETDGRARDTNALREELIAFSGCTDGVLKEADGVRREGGGIEGRTAVG
jgi:hypothetical protein